MPESKNTPCLSRVPVLWGVVVVLVALIIRLIFLSAPLASDDSAYFEMAWNLSSDTFNNAPGQLNFRTGMLGPLAVVQAFFGYSMVAYYVFSMTFAVGLVLVVYAVTRAASGQFEAVISSLLVASSALVVYQGTNVLPDTPNLCFLLLAFHFFTKVDDTKSRRELGGLALAAACGFFAYLVRAPNSIFLVAIPVYEFLVYRSLRRTLYFASFFAGFVVVECIFYLIATGNPVRRLSMVPKGVSLWVQHQQTRTISEFIFDPFRNMMQWTTGWILLGFGIPATVHVIRQKNHKLIALLSGGLVIFVAYSYSMTSFDPLVRALPLQLRYITAFTCVLAMITGSWLVSLGMLTVSRFKMPALGVPAIFGLLFLVQLRDLPTLPGALFFTDDSYYVGDRLVRDYMRKHDDLGPVYAYPGAVFRMFGGYSDLDLQDYQPNTPPSKGRYYLLNKPRVSKTVRLARENKDADSVKYGEMLLQHNPAYDYLVETNSIVLFYMSRNDLVAHPVIDLAKHEVWKHGDAISRVEGSTLAFDIAPTESVLYINTFADPFLKPGPASHEIYKALKPSSHYEIEVTYHLAAPLGSLRFFMREYDEERSIQQMNQPMPAGSGAQVFKTSITTKAAYDSFRIFLRVTNKQAASQLRIDSIVISQLQ